MMPLTENAIGYVYSLCDLTGNALRPWAAAGYICYAVDTQHSIRRPRHEKVGPGEIRYEWGDARSWKPKAFPIAFVFAWPPCTHLAVSGARDFNTKGLRMLTDALDLFNACEHAAAWSGAPYLIENPAGVLSTHHRRPDHLFDPCDYAGYADDPAEEAYTKKTCLWVGNGFVMPERRPVAATLGSMMHLLPPSEDRQNLRSVTPAGFARAVFQSNGNKMLILGAA